MRTQSLVLILMLGVIHALAAAQVDKAKSSGSSNGWKKTAESFMNDLVTNHIDDALDLMEPDFIKAVGSRSKAKSALERLFDYCGRPLDSQFQHEERGFKVYLDGRRKEMHKFFYDATTNQYPKGVCFFAIDVVSNGTGGEYKVTTVGPLKRAGGR
ncbi:MAG: hypothetical protein LAP38_07655 [Acidobacteriia bacterium]|nr:hypothetical protein [Terriglobia bacterium]